MNVTSSSHRHNILFSNRIWNGLQHPEGLIFVDLTQFKNNNEILKIKKMKCDENLKKIIFLMSVIFKKNMVQKWPLSDQFGFPGSKLSVEN